MSNKFISARVPDELLEQLETRIEATGESKSSILIAALTEYLQPKSSNADIDFNTEKRLMYFEQWVLSLIRSLDSRITSLEQVTLEEIRNELNEIAETVKSGNSPTLVATAKKQRRLMPGAELIT